MQKQTYKNRTEKTHLQNIENQIKAKGAARKETASN